MGTMTHNEINQNIIGAINILVESALSQANFDKTIAAVIDSCVDEVKGKYKVKYQDAHYYATSDNAEVKYSDNTEVYVLIPGNDFSKEKKILGTVKDLGDAYIESVNQGQKYEIIGGDAVYGDNSEIGFCSYHWEKKENYCWNLYNADKDNNRLSVDEVLMQEYATKATQLKIGASFKTSLPFAQRGHGNYGLKIDIDFRDSSTGNIVTHSCLLDIGQMLGTPYNFKNYSVQDLIFDIDGKNYVRIKSIDFIMYDFKSDDSISLNDIFVKDIVIAPVAQVESELLLSSYLTIEDDGGRILNSSNGKSSIKFTAKVFVKGKEAAAEDLQCYWFIEHSGLSTSHPLFNQYGGQGWRCLNGYIEIKEEGAEPRVKWEAGSPYFTVKAEEMQASKANYKCVCVYEDKALPPKEFQVTNANPAYKLELTAEDGITKFAGGRGQTTLTLNINDGNPPENVTYYWSKRDSSDVYSVFDENANTARVDSTFTNREMLLGIGLMASNIQTAIANSKKDGYAEHDILRESAIFNSAHSAVRKGFEEEKSLMPSRIASLVGIDDNSATVKEALDVLLKYYQNRPIAYKHEYELVNLPVNTIVNYNTITCSVFSKNDLLATDETYLGSANIRLENNVVDIDTYNLTLVNGNQTFKYNAAGLAPNHPENIMPQTIENIGFNLFDKQGKQFSDMEIAEKCEWTWKIPKTNTMITGVEAVDVNGAIVPEGTSAKEENGYLYIPGNKVRQLKISIAQTFAFDQNQNDIELEVRIKRDDGQAEAVKTYTNLTFLKDGTSGTNGTEYSCRIVPNFAGQTLEGYPTISCYKNTSWEYYLNAGVNGETALHNSSNKQWFRAELFNNGVPITSGTTVYWSLLSQESLNHMNTDDDDTYESIDVIKVDKNGNFSMDEDALLKFLKLNSNSKTYYLSNILQARISYNSKSYYATLPIAIVHLQDDKYRIQVKPNTGFNEVVYSPSGEQPSYASAHPFEIQTTHKAERTENGTSYLETIDVSASRSGSYNMRHSWYYTGNPWSYTTEDGKKVAHRHIVISRVPDPDNGNKTNDSNGNALIRYKRIIEPYEKFDGRAIDVGFRCVIKNEDANVGTLYFPIYMHLNKYGFTNLNDWNGSSVKIKDDEYILAPQVGAGVKDSENGFTGIVMGVQAQPTGDEAIGLLGYHQGERTIFLDANSGKAEFGKQGAGQIVLDPTKTYNGKPLAQIYSGNYFKADGSENQEGLLIDLSTPQINFGSGNFNVNAEGKITSKSGSIGGWTINSIGLYSGGDGIANALVGMCSDNTPNNGLGRTIYTYRPKAGANSGNPVYQKKQEHVAFWAGDGRFAVTHDGYLRADKIQVTNGDKSSNEVDERDIFITTNFNEKDKDSTWTDQFPCIHSGAKTGRDVNNVPGFYLGHNGLSIGYGVDSDSYGRGVKFRQNGSGYVGDWNITKSGRFYTEYDDGNIHKLTVLQGGAGRIYAFAVGVQGKNLEDIIDNDGANEWKTAPFRVKQDGQMYAKKAYLEDGASLAGKLTGVNANAIIDLNAAQPSDADTGSGSDDETADDGNAFEWAEGNPSDKWSMRIGYDYTPTNTYGYIATYLYPDKITLYNSYNNSDGTTAESKVKDCKYNMSGSISYYGGAMPDNDSDCIKNTYGAANFVFGRSIYLRETALRIGRFGITALSYGARKDSDGNAYDNIYLGPSRAFCWRMRYTMVRGRDIEILAYGNKSSKDYKGNFLVYAGNVELLDVDKKPYCRYAWTTTSDERVKNISNLDNRYISFFKKIKPIMFTFKDNPNAAKTPGYSAQQVKEALYESNLTMKDFSGLQISKDVPKDFQGSKLTDFHTLSYQDFIPIHTAVLQDTIKQLEEEKEKTKKLENTVEYLLQEMQDIKARLS